ncbi:hypothetical protein HCCG_00809 [Helicobacter cinaedi CCUG 18818 = ATCC BAA-847]|uniref:Uncharacterized protein n=1 Tax=Helicobacter cinaedi CCUG 18818 = ATCC BAA-847 TaxID=537971 RepID=A0ABN0BBY1_9HELI|nr:hypothetical protein HCCG_00809 [Helicobacter cinaedi CCUG 18818 = ATCC BAA-847]
MIGFCLSHIYKTPTHNKGKRYVDLGNLPTQLL